MIQEKNFFNRSSDYKPLFSKLAVQLGEEEAALIAVEAGQELNKIIAQYPDISKGERNHTDGHIFPRIALYRVLQQRLGDQAMVMIDETIDIQGRKVGNSLRKFTALPLMERLFLKIFASMAKNMFGEKNGFKQTLYSTPKGTIRFDITDCIYCRYCRLCDCPELIHTFCNSDEYCFGNLSKITFIREETLENGSKCDFTLKIDNANKKHSN